MNILFLTQRLPYAPNRGDRIRAFHLIRALAACADVSVVSLVHDANEASHAVDVRAIACDVHVARVPRWSNRLRGALRLPTSHPLTLELLHAPAIYASLRRVVGDHTPDLVFAFCSSMARYAMEPPLDRFPFLLDIVDVDSEKWRELGRSGPWPKRLVYRREARCLAAFERTAVRAAKVTLACNQKEADTVRQFAPEADVRVLQNGIDLQAFGSPSPPSDHAYVVFSGVLDYPPNEEAALRLARGIWPLVRQARPDARLMLVGAHPTATLHDCSKADPSVEVTGAVPDVAPFLWNAAVAAVPLKTARGVQNKVLEALAAGLPAIVSPCVLEGLPDAARPGCVVADSDMDFVTAILQWLDRSPQKRREFARRARLESLTWQEQLQDLCGIARQAAAMTFRSAR